MSTNYYPVPDPTGAAAYVIDSASKVFMGAKLVEYRYNDGDSVAELWHIGSTTEVFADPDQVRIASLDVGTARSAGDHLLATPTQTLIHMSDLETDPVTETYWICGDGDDGALHPAGDELPWPLATDQRLEDTFRVYHQTFTSDDWILRNVPELTDRRAVPVEANTNYAASVWAGIITGDTSTEAVTPDPPDPFTQEQTLVGLHTASDHGIVFSRINPDDTPGFSAWEGAFIEWHLADDYAGGTPHVSFGFSPVVTALLDDIPEDTPTEIPDDGTTVAAYNTAYYTTSPGEPPHVVPGSLVIIVTDPDFPDPEVLDHITVTITGSVEIIPVASYVYRAGQYRFTDDIVDETSSYDPPPGTEQMRADFVDVDCDRWVAVLGMLYDANDYGSNTGFSLAVYRYDFCAAGELAPLRLYPRGDDRGVAPSPRNYPPPKQDARNYSQEPT